MSKEDIHTRVFTMLINPWPLQTSLSTTEKNYFRFCAYIIHFEFEFGYPHKGHITTFYCECSYGCRALYLFHNQCSLGQDYRKCTERFDVLKRWFVFQLWEWRSLWGHGGKGKVQVWRLFQVTIILYLFKKEHRKKRFASFPSPAGMSLPNFPWAWIMTS